jgi:long-chain acyl-CoA synthetase
MSHATLRDMLHRAARWFPDNDAAVDEAERCTYAELLERSREMASLYHELGVRKGDRVALLLYPSVLHVVAFCGAVEIGAVPVALHTRESGAVLSAVVHRVAPRVLVHDAGLADTVGDIRASCPFVTAYVGTRPGPEDPAPVVGDPIIPDALEGRSLTFEPSAAREGDPAAIVLSSGTTGTPKGIVHTHRTLLESARGGSYVWGAIPHDAIVNTMTTAFIGWYNISLPFLNVGAKTVFLRRFTPRTFLEAVQAERATVGFLVPTMWRLLLQEPLGEYDLSSIRLVGFAGEPMDPTTLARIREQISPHVINVYGTTETGSCSAGTIMFEQDLVREGKLTSVGKPLLNADVRAIEPGGTVDQEVPVGELGEIVICGPSVASEVFDDVETGRRIFEGPWWHSGDMGRIDEDGYVFLEGRVDDMIISGGINVLPTRVEDVLLSHPGVQQAGVVGLADDTWGQVVAAFVVTQDGITAEELDRFVQDSDLSSYQRPRRYVHVEELPRTASGKVNRRALRTEAPA